MRYVKVTVERDERLSVPREVPAWEIPVLQLIHGHEKVEVGESVELKSTPKRPREYPDSGFEYDRLQRRYGENPSDGVHWVAKVYGEGALGVQALGRAIEAEKAADVDPLS